jgi:serine/threonine protein kinase
LHTQYLRYALAARPALLQAIRHHYGRFMVYQSTWEANSPDTDIRDSSEMLSLYRHGFCSACGCPHDHSQSVCQRCNREIYSPNLDPLLHRQLGQWRLSKLLGEGGMGIVYEGQNIQTKKPCAIKILRSTLSADHVAVQRFYREVQIMRRLHHPAIIEIYDFDFHRDIGFCLIMELLRGCSLADYLDQHSRDLSYDEIYRIIAPICDAMHYAHQQDIVHRDLKPDNIFLLDTDVSTAKIEINSIKILDFGIAKLLQAESERLTQTGSTLGTPLYISPEQAVAKHIDHRSDIYSLSVILFELLTRKSLFEADSPFQYLMRHVYAEPPKLSQARKDRQYPEALEHLLVKSLSKQPTERPSSMKEMKELLLQAIQVHLREICPQTISPLEGRNGVYFYRGSAEDPSAEPSSKQGLPSGAYEARTDRSRLQSSAKPQASSAETERKPSAHVENPNLLLLQSDEWEVCPNTPVQMPKSTPKTHQLSDSAHPHNQMSANAETANSVAPKAQKASILGLDREQSASLSTPQSAKSSPNENLGVSILVGEAQSNKAQSASSPRTGLRTARKSAADRDSRTRQKVVIHSPRWDLQQPQRRKKWLIWIFILLLFASTGAGAYIYREPLFNYAIKFSISAEECAAAQLAWQNFAKIWYPKSLQPSHPKRPQPQRKIKRK